MLEAESFDDADQDGVTVSANLGAISERQFAEDHDGADLAFGPVVVVFGSRDVDEVEQAITVLVQAFDKPKRRSRWGLQSEHVVQCLLHVVAEG